jgi:hypothetical protein
VGPKSMQQAGRSWSSRWLRCNDVPERQLVQRRGFPRVVEPDDDYLEVSLLSAAAPRQDSCRAEKGPSLCYRAHGVYHAIIPWKRAGPRASKMLCPSQPSPPAARGSVAPAVDSNCLLTRQSQTSAPHPPVRKRPSSPRDRKRGTAANRVQAPLGRGLRSDRSRRGGLTSLSEIKPREIKCQGSGPVPLGWLNVKWTRRRKWTSCLLKRRRKVGLAGVAGRRGKRTEARWRLSPGRVGFCGLRCCYRYLWGGQER